MSFQEMLNDDGIYYTLFYYIFKVITFGYIPHILFGLFICVGFMFLIILIKERRQPFYIFKEKYKYTRYFSYLFLMEKLNFIKYSIIELKFFIQTRESFKFWLIVIITCIIVAIIFIFAWDSIVNILQGEANNKLNQSLNNISLNNTKSI